MATVRLIWIHPSTLDDFRESYQADNQPVPGYWHWMMSFHILTGSQDENSSYVRWFLAGRSANCLLIITPRLG